MSTHRSSSPQWLSDFVARRGKARRGAFCGPTSRFPVPDSAAWFPSSAGNSAFGDPTHHGPPAPAVRRPASLVWIPVELVSCLGGG